MPIAPVHDSKSVATDPQFQHRMPLYRVDEVGAEQLPLPLKVVDEELPRPPGLPRWVSTPTRSSPTCWATTKTGSPRSARLGCWEGSES